MSKFFLETRFVLCFLFISIIPMQFLETSSLLLAESTIRSLGAISYDNYNARPLHVEGNQIKDDVGNVVYLRGVTRARSQDHPSGCWGAINLYSRSVVDMTLYKMKSYGINVMRDSLVVDYWFTNLNVNTESGTITYTQMLNDLLTRCEDRGIYVILRGWSLYQGNPQLDMAYPPYNTRKGVAYGPHPNMMTSTDFVNWWVAIVDQLGSHNNLIIEPWNEAFGAYRAQAAALDEFQTVWQSVINAVRVKENEKGYCHHLILPHFGYSIDYYGDMNAEWKNLNWITTHPLTGDNIVYSIHCYRHSGSVGLQEPESSRSTAYSTIKAIYIEEGVYNKSLTYPIIVGENGGFIGTDGEDVWMENTYIIWNEWGLSYCQSQWRDTQAASLHMLEANTEWTVGGTVNFMGQILVDAIAQGG